MSKKVYSLMVRFVSHV